MHYIYIYKLYMSGDDTLSSIYNIPPSYVFHVISCHLQLSPTCVFDHRDHREDDARSAELRERRLRAERELAEAKERQHHSYPADDEDTFNDLHDPDMETPRRCANPGFTYILHTDPIPMVNIL